jgi:Fe-S cluster assembly protein SufD
VVVGGRSAAAGHSSGRGVFTGRVIVRPHAQKTDAAQSVKNLLLDDDSTCNARPWLEIHADDVRCTHGAAIGRLDDESLFYLQSRGIPRDEARRVLTYAFAAGMIVGIDHAPTRLVIERCVQAWLDRIGVA